MALFRSLVLVVVCAVFAFAQEDLTQAEKSWSLSLNGGVVSKYLWRGVNLHDGPAFQPGVEFSSHGVTAGFWSSYNFGDEGGFAEADYYLNYGKAVPFAKACEVTLGYSHLTYPTEFGGKESWEGEWSVELSFDVFSSPTIGYFLIPANDYRGVVSQYFDLGLSHEFEVMKNLTASPTVNVGFAMKYADATAEWSSDFSVLGLGASATYNSVVSITPQLFYQVPLSDAVDGEGETKYENNFYFGLSVGYEL